MENNSAIRRILVWSGKLRLAHGGIALSVLGLLATGLLIQHAPSLASGASEIHQILVILLVTSMALRIWLLFTDKTTAGIGALIPSSAKLKSMGDMIKFYVTFGKYKLPSWHAHNPLWMPLYAAALVLLLVMIVSGLLLNSHPLLFGKIYLPNVHSIAANFLLIFTVAHIITSIMHDIKGSNSNISAMLSGYRIFIFDDENKSADKAQPQKIQFYSPNSDDKK